MWFNCFIPASKTWNPDPAARGTVVFCVTVGRAECCLMFQMRQMELNIKWVFIAESTESSHWSENSKCCDETPRGAQLQRLRAFIPKVRRGERAGGTHSCRHLTKRDKKANLNNTQRATLTKIKEEETQQNRGPRLMWQKRQTQTETKADVDAQRRLRYTTNREHVLLWNLEIYRNRKYKTQNKWPTEKIPQTPWSLMRPQPSCDHGLH